MNAVVKKPDKKREGVTFSKSRNVLDRDHPGALSVREVVGFWYQDAIAAIGGGS